MAEYDQWRAVAPCYYRGEVVFGAGQPVGASHPMLQRWIADGLVVSTSASSTRATSGRLYLGSRGVGRSFDRADVVVPPPFTVASYSAGAHSTSGTTTVAAPSGTVAGDLLLAVQWCDENGNLAGMTAPDGSWAAAGSGGTSAAGFGKVWTKTATGSEPTSYTFTGPAGGTSTLITDSFGGSGSWSSSWINGQTTTGASATQSSGEGVLNCGSAGSYAGKKTMAANVANRTDSEWLMSFTYNASEAYLSWFHRGDGAYDGQTGYQLRVDVGSTNNVTLYRVTGYSGVQKAQTSVTISANTKYKIRYRIVGANIKCRVWDASTGEPGTWPIDYTDPSPISSAGASFVQVTGGNSGGSTVKVDDATLSDPNTSGTTPTLQVTILRVTGASTSNPFLVAPTWASSTTAGTSHSTPAIVTTAQSLYVGGWHIRMPSGSNTWTLPGGTTAAGPLTQAATASLTYDFTTQDSTNFTGWGGNAAVSAGQGVITPTGSYPAIGTVNRRSIVGTSVSVQVPQVLNTGNGTTETLFYAEDAASNRLSFVVNNGNLIFREIIGGVASDTSVTYNGTSHAYWRLAVTGLTVNWDTSPDGSTWTTRRTKTTAVATGNVVVVMSAGYYGTEPSPGTAKYDNLVMGATTAIAMSDILAWQSLSTAQSVSAKAATSSATSTSGVGELTFAFALRLAGTEPPPPSGGMPSQVAGQWWHTWCAPNLANWPADIIGSGVTAGLCNHVTMSMAQSASSGTGSISWGPGDGTSAAAATAAIAAVRARNVNVVLGIGGSDNGGVKLTTSTHVTQMTNSIATLKTQYGFNGIDFVMQPSANTWNQTQLVSLCSGLKTAHGSTFIIGLTGDNYGQYTNLWISALLALGSSYDYFSLQVQWFPEARDSRLTTVCLEKLKTLSDAGVPLSKVLLFFMTKPPENNVPTASPVGVTRAAWIASKAAYPTLLGAMHFESRIEGNKNPSWPWQRDVGQLIRTG